MTTSFAGALFGINPYDQPAVELGKEAAFALMGKPGDEYEEFAQRIQALYPYPLSRQKLGVFKVDSSPFVKAVGTEGARRATGVPTATPYTSAGVR